MKKFLLPLLFSLPSAAHCAQLQVSGAEWQISRSDGQKRLPYLKADSLKLNASGALQGRPRLLLNLLNSGLKPAEGVVLRYAFSVRISSDAGEGFWTIPFQVGETRVSRVAPGASHGVKIYQVNLGEQLRRLRGTGFRPRALKVRSMIEPRSGGGPSALFAEFDIPFEEAR